MSVASTARFLAGSAPAYRGTPSYPARSARRHPRSTRGGRRSRPAAVRAATAASSCESATAEGHANPVPPIRLVVLGSRTDDRARTRVRTLPVRGRAWPPAEPPVTTFRGASTAHRPRRGPVDPRQSSDHADPSRSPASAQHRTAAHGTGSAPGSGGFSQQCGNNDPAATSPAGSRPRRPTALAGVEEHVTGHPPRSADQCRSSAPPPRRHPRSGRVEPGAVDMRTSDLRRYGVG